MLSSINHYQYHWDSIILHCTPATIVRTIIPELFTIHLFCRDQLLVIKLNPRNWQFHVTSRVKTQAGSWTKQGTLFSHKIELIWTILLITKTTNLLTN